MESSVPRSAVKKDICIRDAEWKQGGQDGLVISHFGDEHEKRVVTVFETHIISLTAKEEASET